MSKRDLSPERQFLEQLRAVKFRSCILAPCDDRLNLSAALTASLAREAKLRMALRAIADAYVHSPVPVECEYVVGIARAALAETEPKA